ncbi:hypothetical protein ACFOD4_05320 [Pseudoroseomonas globiformis]|uniref:DUF1795 domain-containing protein n=1 Tax=Teichococcus globiformis TaxID=2307229 RepID=A0ABV7FZ63_9PROT
MRDVPSGLLLDPPPPYAASRLPAVSPQTARYALRRPDAPQGCQVAFVPAPERDRGRSQAQLNELARSPEWRNLERLRLSQAYDIGDAAPVDLGELTALRLVGTLRARDGISAAAKATRSVFTILETPRGRTTLVCVAGTDFIERQAEFEAVARGVHPPR